MNDEEIKKALVALDETINLIHELDKENATLRKCVKTLSRKISELINEKEVVR